MPEINIETETDGNNHWSYEISVTDDGNKHQYKVTLSWADYDLWSHGRVSPEKVVHAIFTFLLERESANQIMQKFDCSVVRRFFPEVDKELPGLI